jgi:SAM-dependent methyltransferase
MALRSAIELDLFTKIGSGRSTAQSLAAACAASKRGVQLLCDNLVLQGHLWKEGSRYHLTLNSRLYLTRSSPAYMGSAVEFFASDGTIAAFSRLTEAVKRGRCASRDALSADEAYWVKFASAMAPLAQPVAEFAAEALAVDSAGPIQVLDIAAGHGIYGCEIALRNPDAHIFALDSSAVLQVAAHNSRKRGLADRYHLLPGDALKVKFGGPYDIILAANFAHHLDASGNVRLFKKCRRALKPRGRFVVIDCVPDPEGGAPGGESFALQLLAVSKYGTIYTFREYSRMLRAAGFERLRRLKSDVYGNWIITASV